MKITLDLSEPFIALLEIHAGSNFSAPRGRYSIKAKIVENALVHMYKMNNKPLDPNLPAIADMNLREIKAELHAVRARVLDQDRISVAELRRALTLLRRYRSEANA